MTLTAEELAKWGKREGEDDREHARRCSAQLWEGDPRGPTVPMSRVAMEQILARAIHDNDAAMIDVQLELLANA